MTLPTRDRQASFFDVSFLAEDLFGPTDPYSLFRNEILPALEAKRDALCGMYCADNGRTPIEPVILAGITVLQFMETAPDRRAGQNVRLHLGWEARPGPAGELPGLSCHQPGPFPGPAAGTRPGAAGL